MGVGLKPIITHMAPECMEYKTLNDFRGMNVALDTFIYIYKGVLGYRYFTGGEDKLNKNGEIVTHLEYIYDQILKLHKHEIITLWIFDGKQPDIKREELAKRKLEKQRLQLQYEKSPVYNSNFPKHQKNFTINKNILTNLYQMLRLMGIQYIKANGEADNLGSMLSKNEIVGGLITEDWDALPFGCKNLIKNFGTKEGMYTVNIQNLLESLKLTQEEFIDVCILLGTDFCPTISGLEGLNAYNLYTQFKDMEKLLEHLNQVNQIDEIKYVIPENFIKKWKKAKEYYMSTIQQNFVPERIIWNRPNRERLIDFLCNECLFDRKRSVERVDKLMNLYHNYITNKKRRIDNVDSWRKGITHSLLTL